MRGRGILVGLLAAWVAGSPAIGSGDVVIDGATMGTTFAVRLEPARGARERARYERLVEAALARVDALMSTYREDSELERFNRYRGTAWRAVSPETALVASIARELAFRSGGAFDPTVAPLVRLWGFGRETGPRLPPAPERLAAARATVGFRGYHVEQTPPRLRKDRAALELDLSGLAKGFAVDAIASRLIEAGVEHFLVEIGGELRARGMSPRGSPWVVEVEDPFPRSGGAPVWVTLRDAAIATSGPYRHFAVRQGVRFGHVLDPRTGAPAASDLISVSVIAAQAVRADGWATALLAAGATEGWALAEREHLAALFVSERDGAQHRRATAPFDAHRRGSVPREETR